MDLKGVECRQRIAHPLPLLLSGKGVRLIDTAQPESDGNDVPSEIRGRGHRCSEWNTSTRLIASVNPGDRSPRNYFVHVIHCASALLNSFRLGLLCAKLAPRKY
jgi:hypothetical protein